MGNWFSNLWKGLSGAAKGAGASIGGAAQSAAKAAPQGLASLGASIGNMGKYPAQMGFSQASTRGPAAMPNPASFLKGLSGQAMLNPAMRGASDVSANPATKTGGIGKSILDMFGSDTGKIGAGLVSNLAGQAFAPKVNAPDISSLESVQNFRNYDNASLPSGVEDSINRSVDVQHQDEMKRLQDVYKNARPGTDYSTDSAYQRDLANLERRQTLNRADAQSNALLQFNQQELGHLQELAQTDIYNIMIKLGMDAQEAEQFKQSFSNVGSMFLQSGLGLNNFKVA